MGAMILITISLLFSLPRVLSEFTSLSCGSPTGTKFLDRVTNISYDSDTDFISTGVGSKIKSLYQRKTEQRNWYLRSFPRGFRNCYTFNLTSGERYLIRTTFLHGGFDNNSTRRFELHLGVNRWTAVSTTNETEEIVFEMIHLLTTDRLQVCLVKTGDSTPFITALELRKLNSEAYINSTASLQTFLRADVGSISNQSLRYGEGVFGADVFDRIWQPYNSQNWSQISTNNSVDVSNEYKPPETAMITASVPTDPDAPMNFSLTRVDPASIFYVCLHFSEIQDLKSNETREFNILYNGRLIFQSLRPPRFYTFSYIVDHEVGPNANGEYTFSIQRTFNSTLPPLLNAMEIYLVKSLGKLETATKEVDAIIRIKSRCGRKKIDWEGDPCVPHEYMWNGLNCNYKHNKQPRIVSLNLTASGIIGEIPDSLSNLTKLEVLDLSNNNLTGSVPEFLADMESLKFINLSSNELNGSIPKRLLDRAQRGLVTLSVDEPGLCSSPSCATTSKKKKNIVVASVATTLFLILLIIAVIIVICKRKRKADRHPSSENNNLQQLDQSSFSDIPHNVFTYEDLAQATCNFSSTNLIGQGGFGYVHKGVISDGTEVAIKQLKAGSRQGEHEFLAEIEIISRVHHKHLVSLLGNCITGSQRLLVYEFVPNKTLEFHLHEREAPVMEWANRMKIALGSAKALSYLHDDCNPKTIHRDVKAANIIIDNSYESKLSDFGLARSCSDTDTHVSTRVMGTFGYLAPEYASSGKLTDKSDVFSFGVVLLELITGRRPFDKSKPFLEDDSIVDWAKPLMTKALKDGNFDGFVDPRLENDFNVIEMTRVVACAAASVHHSAERRPRMSQIVRAFEGNISLDDITEGIASEHSTDYSSYNCSTQYREDLKKFKKMALESQSYGSSGLTSENVQNLEPSGSSSITEKPT